MWTKTVLAHGTVEHSSANTWIDFWTLDPALILMLILGICYYRGSAIYRRSKASFLSVPNRISFWAGILTIILALCSPLDYWAAGSFASHMIQHLLLSMLAAPLIYFGKPMAPILKGIPWKRERDMLVGILRSSAYRKIKGLFKKLFFLSALYFLIFWLWHNPSLYNLALNNLFWHWVEHAMFFWSAFFFWGAIFNKSFGLLKLPILVFALIQNSVLSALLSFSDSQLYKFAYHNTIFSNDPVQDQKWGGLLMWGFGSMMYWIAFSWVFVQLAKQSKGLVPQHSPE